MLASSADIASNLAGSIGGIEVKGGLRAGLLGMAWTIPITFGEAAGIPTSRDMVADVAAAEAVMAATLANTCELNVGRCAFGGPEANAMVELLSILLPLAV